MKKRVFAFGVALVFLLSFILPNSNVAYATETNTSIEESVNKTGDILTNELDNTITDVEETELSSEEITIESNTLEDQGKVENKNDSNVMVQPMTTVEEPTDPVEPTDSVEPADPVEPIPVIIEGYVKANLFVRPAKGSTESLGIISRGTKVSGTEDGNWLKFTFNGSEAYIAKSFIVDEWVEETLAGYISATIVVRPSIGSSSRLGLIEAGTKVSGIVKGAWLEIQYNGRTAYIAKSFVTDQNPSIDGIMSSNLVVRPAKNSNQSLGIIKFRTPVSGVIDGSWVRFNYNGKTAFIARSFVVEANREDKGYLTSSIYVRPSAGSSSNIGIISKGSFVEGVTYGDWLKISFNGKFGYIAKSFLTDKVVTETRYATAGVNIRSSKVNGKILSVAKMGDTFTGFLDGSWFKTTYNGQTAYISAKYLTTNYVPKINYTGYAKFQVFYRWSPSKDAVTSGLIKKGEKIQGKLSNGWIEFYRNGRTYYTLAENFTQQKAIKSDWTVINNSSRPMPASTSTKLDSWSWGYPSTYGKRVLANNNGAYRIGDKVYITFDNGYEYKNLTASILDTLKAKNVKSVFFVTGSYIKENPQLVRRMIREGHIVGNHTNKHLSPHNVSAERIIQDIKEWETVYKNVIGTLPKVKLYRPAAGVFSERIVAGAYSMGYKTLLWDFGYADWDTNSQPSTRYALNHIKKHTKKGSIILLHSVSKTNTKILGQYIDWLRANGYVIGSF